MEEFWKIAVGLTGISGVGAFVIYGLYKEWIRSPLLSDLTRSQRFKLFQLFLVLTFLFTIAAFALRAYESSLVANTDEQIPLEFVKTMASRYEEGRRILSEKMQDKSLSVEDREPLAQFFRSYVELTHRANVALESSQLNLWYEETDKLHRLLRSTEAKKYLPADLRVHDIAWDPELNKTENALINRQGVKEA